MATSLISNPPYNMKHKLPDLAAFMSRYAGYALPPESNANYAFILSGLNMIDDKAVFLLPNGVLSSGVSQEKEIRKQLVKENLLLAVITLPGNMFESTNIPTVILVFDKHKTTRKIALFDLSEHCVEETRDQRGQFGGTSHTNRTYHKQIKTIPADVMKDCLELIESGKDKDGLCKWITPEQAADNDYNLTPRRFFDIKTDIIHRPFSDIAEDRNRIIRQKNAIKIKMNRTAAKRLGFDCFKCGEIDLSASFNVVGQKAEEENFMTYTNGDGIQISVSTKEGIHPLVIEFLSHWKQMIMYLNAEENRYLAEFRDALLPDLMTGQIEITNENS